MVSPYNPTLVFLLCPCDCLQLFLQKKGRVDWGSLFAPRSAKQLWWQHWSFFAIMKVVPKGPDGSEDRAMLLQQLELHKTPCNLEY